MMVEWLKKIINNKYIREKICLYRSLIQQEGIHTSRVHRLAEEIRGKFVK